MARAGCELEQIASASGRQPRGRVICPFATRSTRWTRRSRRALASQFAIDLRACRRALAEMSSLRRRTPSGSTNGLSSDTSEPVASTSGAVSPGALAAYVRRKMPAAASLLIGVMVGLLVAQTLSGRREVVRRSLRSLSTAQPADTWRGGSKAPSWAHSNRVSPARHSLAYTPSLEQRRRVFQILGTLTG